MTNANDATTTAAGASGHGLGGRWLYWVLFAAQTLGAATVYWKSIPVYRQLVAAPQSYDSEPGQRAIWALSSIVVIQVAYWTRYYVRPLSTNAVNAPVGHVLLFLARLSFVLATSVFSFLFISRKPEDIHMYDSGIVITVALLFSLYCYTLELEHLGKRLLPVKL